MKLTRRGFLKLLTATAAALGLSGGVEVQESVCEFSVAPSNEALVTSHQLNPESPVAEGLVSLWSPEHRWDLYKPQKPIFVVKLEGIDEQA